MRAETAGIPGNKHQNHTAAAGQTAEAAEELRQVSGQLNTTVEKFRI